MNPKTIMARASRYLYERGLDPELSPQAQAVVTAIVEAITSELLVPQANIRQRDAVQSTPTGRMKRPSTEEVRAHGVEIGLPASECDRFRDHFESNGWLVGRARTPMRLWTAALANWKRTWESGAFQSDALRAIMNKPKTIVEQQQERTAARIASGSL